MPSLQPDPSLVKRHLQRAAIEEGFAALGFAAAEPRRQDIERYDRWLAAGHHADMGWLQRHRDAKLRPQQLLARAATVVALATAYGHPLPPDPGGLSGRVSRFAWGRDYHRVVGKRLRRLQRGLQQRFPALNSYASVDSRPVFERAWAAQAGLAFAGCNTCAILPGRGSYFFLATLLIDLSLPPDAPAESGCGDCRRCLQACPTGALLAPGVLDARRCLSYLSVEHAADLPHDLRPAMGRRVFGCDSCQEACPHVNEHPQRGDPALCPQPTRAWLDLPQLLLTSDEALKERFAGTSLRRAGPGRLKRNACVALGNSGGSAARGALQAALEHSEGLVRRHAAWAAARCRCSFLIERALRRECEPATHRAMEQELDRGVEAS